MIAIGDRQRAPVRALLPRCSAIPNGRKDARFNSNRARVENRDAIDGLINAALASDKADTWLAKLMAVGVPVRQDQLGGAGARPIRTPQLAAWSRRSSIRCTAP